MVALTNRMVAVRVAVVAAPLRVSFRALRISRPHIPLTSSTGIPTEMADELIRVLHFCGKHGIDIEKAVIEKMAFNDSRPYKHGGKKI
jgi:NTP pyrophosphatase (non-canonical NTP hydrolase)